MSVPRVELEDVEALIPLTVSAGGRVSGLTEYVGRKVIIIVPAEGKKAKKRGGAEG